MRDTLREICELQPRYSADNTPDMQRRGILVRQVLTAALKALKEPLQNALGSFGDDFEVDASDGIGRKTELPWARFYSKRMSPSATQGFYCVLHFSTDGSAAHIIVSCSSSVFRDGYSVVLPPEELDRRTEWARKIVEDAIGTLEPFTDINDFGATRDLPRSFERASALVKTIRFSDIDHAPIEEYLVRAASMLKTIYEAQSVGRELSPADQDALRILAVTKPQMNAGAGQGYGLTAPERKAVELRAMDLARDWFESRDYQVKDTSASKPYDFEANLSSEKLFVEVKGTTSDRGDAITMTHTEVDIHRERKGHTVLCIVTAIELDRSKEEPAASGGSLEVLMNWDIDDWSLKPTVFRISRSPRS